MSMTKKEAVSVIESVSGFTDDTTPVGEAWRTILDALEASERREKKLKAERDELLSMACDAEQVDWRDEIADPGEPLLPACWYHTGNGEPIGRFGPWGRAKIGLEKEAALVAACREIVNEQPSSS